jgi:hypothetical protein
MIDHAPQIFNGRFQALVRSHPFPDLHCNLAPWIAGKLNLHYEKKNWPFYSLPIVK